MRRRAVGGFGNPRHSRLGSLRYFGCGLAGLSPSVVPNSRWFNPCQFVKFVSQKDQAGFKAGLTCENDLILWRYRYAATTRFLRRIRSVLAPKGSSNSAPAIIVVGSGTAKMATLAEAPPSTMLARVDAYLNTDVCTTIV